MSIGVFKCTYLDMDGVHQGLVRTYLDMDGVHQGLVRTYLDMDGVHQGLEHGHIKPRQSTKEGGYG